MESAYHGKSSDDQVSQHTHPLVNRDVMMQTEKTMLFYSHYPELIEKRINALKKEWDIERALETNASILGMFGLFMAVIVRRGLFFLVPIIVLGFLVQHAIQGWCPPVSVFRRLGMRTRKEIQLELYGLRMLRGDFNEVPGINAMDVKDRTERIMGLLS